MGREGGTLFATCLSPKNTFPSGSEFANFNDFDVRHPVVRGTDNRN